jgi:hypothetical protein
MIAKVIAHPISESELSKRQLSSGASEHGRSATDVASHVTLRLLLNTCSEIVGMFADCTGNGVMY